MYNFIFKKYYQKQDNRVTVTVELLQFFESKESIKNSFQMNTYPKDKFISSNICNMTINPSASNNLQRFWSVKSQNMAPRPDGTHRPKIGLSIDTEHSK